MLASVMAAAGDDQRGELGFVGARTGQRAPYANAVYHASRHCGYVCSMLEMEGGREDKGCLETRLEALQEVSPDVVWRSGRAREAGRSPTVRGSGEHEREIRVYLLFKKRY
jgi:hypothetical protein